MAVGAYTGEVGAAHTSSYVDEIVKRFPGQPRDANHACAVSMPSSMSRLSGAGPLRNASEAPSALSVYRSALAAAADGSAVA